MRIALIIFGIVAMLGMVGQMDYDDAVQQEQHYNEMVCTGAWPDYENRAPQC